MNPLDDFDDLPSRPDKPRNEGLTVVMDRGMSLREIEDFLTVKVDFCDVMKLAWSAGLLVGDLPDRKRLYADAGLKLFLGGVIYEAYASRGLFEKFRLRIAFLGMELLEISDAVVDIPHEEKCEHIWRMSQDFQVLSEVGSRVKNIPADQWVFLIEEELKAGAWKVILEGSSSGAVGIFDEASKPRADVIDAILAGVPNDKIIIDAPKKEQQALFINRVGASVNLCNIEPQDVIGLECLRLGLRSDTLRTFFNR